MSGFGGSSPVFHSQPCIANEGEDISLNDKDCKLVSAISSRVHVNLLLSA